MVAFDVFGAITIATADQYTLGKLPVNYDVLGSVSISTYDQYSIQAPPRNYNISGSVSISTYDQYTVSKLPTNYNVYGTVNIRSLDYYNIITLIQQPGATQFTVNMLFDIQTNDSYNLGEYKPPPVTKPTPPNIIPYLIIGSMLLLAMTLEKTSTE